MPTVSEVRVLLERFDAGLDPSGARSCRRVRDLLDETPSPFSRRQYQPGHVTASGLVISPDGRTILLVYHPRVGKWLQPGGHVEPGDAALVDTARREILEETGVPTDQRLAAPVVGVEVHEIPAAPGKPAHLHHDFVFGFRALDLGPPEPPEPNQVVWCPPDQLDRYGADSSLYRAVERAKAWWERVRAAPQTAGGASA